MNLRLFFKVEYHKKRKDFSQELGQELNCWKSFSSGLKELWPESRAASPGSLSFRITEKGTEILSRKTLLINGVSVHHRILKNGDRIVLGSLRLIYEKTELFEPVQEEVLPVSRKTKKILPSLKVTEKELDKKLAGEPVVEEKPGTPQPPVEEIVERSEEIPIVEEKIPEISAEPDFNEKSDKLSVIQKQIKEVDIVQVDAEPEFTTVQDLELKPVVVEKSVHRQKKKKKLKKKKKTGIKIAYKIKNSLSGFIVSVSGLALSVSGAISSGVKTIKTGLMDYIRSISRFRLKLVDRVRKVQGLRLPKIKKPEIHQKWIRNFKSIIQFLVSRKVKTGPKFRKPERVKWKIKIPVFPSLFRKKLLAGVLIFAGTCIVFFLGFFIFLNFVESPTISGKSDVKPEIGISSHTTEIPELEPDQPGNGSFEHPGESIPDSKIVTETQQAEHENVIGMEVEKTIADAGLPKEETVSPITGPPEKIADDHRELDELLSITPGGMVPEFDLDLLFIHAHPDDESLDYGCLMALAAEANLKTGLVTFTDGESGLDLYPDRPVNGSYPDHYMEGDELASARTGEVIAAAEILGADLLIRLGLKNHPYNSKKDELSPEEILEIWGGKELLADRVRDIIRQTKPEIVIAPDAPGKASEHFEHEAVGYLAAEIMTDFDPEDTATPGRFITCIDPRQLEFYPNSSAVNAGLQVKNGKPDGMKSSLREIQLSALAEHKTQNDAVNVGTGFLPQYRSEYYQIQFWRTEESWDEWINSLLP